MRKTSIAGVAALAAAFGLAAASGGAEVIPRGFNSGPELDPRRSAFRQGRRFRDPVRKGGNPAGTKLARKASRGTLTINAIR